MSNPNLKPSDQVAVLGVIDPDVTTASTVTTGWIDMQNWYNVMAIVMAGTLGTSATLDAKFEQATSSGGAGVKDVSGTDITQLTQGGTDDSDKQAVINLSQEDIDFANDFRYVRLSITVGTATSDAGGMVIGTNPRMGPASDNDATTVAEIVN